VTRETFRRSVAKALEEIPLEFQDKMENVEVLVEDFADNETLGSLGIRSPWELLGLYVGVPITERSFFSTGYLPERIYLYRRPILRAAGQPENIVETIREVVIHEIGHHFGFDDDELEKMVRRTD
jgi:predicted Zn-dependent protease with MMP-like domain